MVIRQLGNCLIYELSKKGDYMDDTTKRMINVFQALSSETRLAIIYLLAKKNYDTKELSVLLKKSPATISDHLRILRDLGIIWYTMHGINKIYFLKRRDILKLLDKAQELLGRNS